MTAVASDGLQASPIVRKAFVFAAQQGLAALTSRKLAVATGLSASAVNYQAGSMDDLRQQVALQAHAALGAWRRQFAESLSGGLATVSVEGLVTAAVLDLAGPNRGLALLKAELLYSSTYSEFQQLERADIPFWEARLTSAGCGPAEAQTWIDFIYGVAPLAILDSNFPSLASWLPLLVRRLSDRLARKKSFPASAFPFPPFPTVIPEPASPAGARKIVDAAIEIIAENGVAEFTHRSVAARAGLSLGASTFFFATKTDIIIAAVNELLRRSHIRFHAVLDGSPTVRTALAPGGRLHRDVLALLALYAPVARDPALRSVATVLRDHRGPIALERLRLEDVVADRVDAAMWSTVMLGSFHPCRMQQQNVDVALEERASLHRANLFGK
jgi:AcrR family transcriptional regulator